MLPEKLLLLSIYLSVLRSGSVTGNVISKNLKLELVQILFRHGARTPIYEEAALMPHNETLYEPWGYAQLTKAGMLEEYGIGQMLRRRYKDFLPDLYKAEQVYAYSSGLDRTKASLQLVLAALYPPTGDLTWHDNLNWMPIPIHSNPRPLDILIKPDNCPKYKEHLQEVLNSTEIKDATQEYSDIIQRLESVYKKRVKLSTLFLAYNLILTHKNLNLTLPDWYTNDLLTPLNKASRLHLDALTYTPLLRKLTGGTMIKRFLDNIYKSNRKTNHRKIYLYSAHDKTLYTFARAHGLYMRQLPDYGCSIILEKLRDKQNRFYIKMLLWTGSPKRLAVLKLDNCTEICPLTEYLKIVNQVLPSDEDMRCLFKNLHPKDIEQILNTENYAR